ncbi:MAG TPA: PQQ-binding-like beta-propeller repeat protein [Polyangiaceae bacterium]
MRWWIGCAVVGCSSLVAGCGSGDSAAAPGDDAGAGDDGTTGDATGDAGLGGDGASTDSGPPPEGGPPPCGTEAWATYGHDSRRTSATDACIGGALTLAYQYVPAPPAGKKVNGVYTAIAQSDAAFVAWSSQNDPYLGTSAVDRLDATGARVWTWNSGTDSNLGNWVTSALGSIVVNEDGLYFLDPATGKQTHSNGVDNWGFTAFDATRLYAVNSSHVDGPGLYVGAYDPAEKQLWTKNTYGTCRIDAADSAAGIAVDGATLYYAPLYSPGTGVTLGFASGLYAFDGATGSQTWFQATTPGSTVSVGAGLVYLVETGSGGEKLVARKQSDGTVAWSVDVTGASAQAPVIAMGKVITATPTSVVAYDAGKGGAPSWTVPIAGAATALGVIDFSGGCAGGAVSQSSHPMTALAAALGSSTLVVTAPDGVHVLSLADGSSVWTGKVPKAPGAVFNPVLVGKRVFVEDGQALYALDAP